MDKLSPRWILIDFDDTVAINQSPKVGPEIDGCVRVLRRLVHAGHTLILFTMRVDQELTDAKEWFMIRGIPITYTNRNPAYETGSRKIYGDIIDNKAIGIPLKTDYTIHNKPFVDWHALEKILEERRYL